jgi:hypothetical protein
MRLPSVFFFPLGEINFLAASIDKWPVNGLDASTRSPTDWLLASQHSISSAESRHTAARTQQVDAPSPPEIIARIIIRNRKRRFSAEKSIFPSLENVKAVAHGWHYMHAGMCWIYNARVRAHSYERKRALLCGAQPRYYLIQNKKTACSPYVKPAGCKKTSQEAKRLAI